MLMVAWGEFWVTMLSMPEIRPQILYTHEDTLEIVPEFGDTPEESSAYERCLEAMENDWGAVVTGGGENQHTEVSIEVERTLGRYFTISPDKLERLNKFLQAVNRLLPYHPEDDVDRVYSLDILGHFGAQGVINHQFQRWLNATGIREEVARKCLLAMAIPFGKDQVRKANKGFRYYGHGADAASFRLGLPGGDFRQFGLHRYEETDTGFVTQNGEVEWSWIDLSTLGSCACWGVDGMKRSNLDIDLRTSRLYEMVPHNVDFAHQSLSLLLGAAVLANEAAAYEGREDVFANATWGQERKR